MKARRSRGGSVGRRGVAGQGKESINPSCIVVYLIMKHCKHCNQSKDDSEFYSNQAWCKVCMREHQKMWAAQHRERRREINRAWTARNRERKRTMVKASNAVHRAINLRKLVRPDKCARCGANGVIEAAHASYSELLNVIWLCQPCHRLWDSSSPKTA